MQKFIVSGLLLLCFHAVAFSQSVREAKLFTLNGKIIGKDSGKIVLSYQFESKQIKDTVLILNGAFSFKGNLVEPTSAFIDSEKRFQYAYLFLEPGVMDIILTADKYNEFRMTGSKTQEEQEQLNRLTEQINLRIHKLKAENSSIYDSLKKSTGEAKLNKLKSTLDENERQLSLLKKELKITQNNFIYSNPKSFVSLDLLCKFDKNELISLDSLKTAYDKLDGTTKNSAVGKIIQQNIRKKEYSRIGAMAPDFKAIDYLTNKPVSYSDFKGKNVVLLDFWASWCVPCRAAFPHLRNLYKKYHPKGFEVIAVSTFDINKKALIAAIGKDSTGNWHHVPAAERMSEGLACITKDDIYDNYFVQAIPVQILIGKDGKIVGRWSGHSKRTEDELEKKLAELFKEN